MSAVNTRLPPWRPIPIKDLSVGVDVRASGGSFDSLVRELGRLLNTHSRREQAAGVDKGAQQAGPTYDRQAHSEPLLVRLGGLRR